MTTTFRAAAIWLKVSGAISATINEVADEASGIARSKAPVRKVFKGSRGHASVQSAVEVAAEKTLRRSLGLAPGPVKTQRTSASPIHGFGPLRALSAPGKLKVKTPLTSAGRYELRSGRANYMSQIGLTLGGRLRGEIHDEPAAGEGPVWVAKVVSPTRYAKYVEFGTRHARAQPFLRPALAQVRGRFKERMAAAVRAAGRVA